MPTQCLLPAGGSSARLGLSPRCGWGLGTLGWPKKAGGINGQTLTSPAAWPEVPGMQVAWRIGSTDKNSGKIGVCGGGCHPLAAIDLVRVQGKRIGVANAIGDHRERAGR